MPRIQITREARDALLQAGTDRDHMSPADDPDRFWVTVDDDVLERVAPVGASDTDDVSRAIIALVDSSRSHQ